MTEREHPHPDDLLPGGASGADVDALLARWRAEVVAPPRVDAALAMYFTGDAARPPVVTAAPPAAAATPSAVVASATEADGHDDSPRSHRGNVIAIDAARGSRARRAIVRGTCIGVTAVTLSSGLAAAGVLPQPVRRAVSGAARAVGIEIETPPRPTLRVPSTTTSSTPLTNPPTSRPSTDAAGGAVTIIATDPPATAAPTDAERATGDAGAAGATTTSTSGGRAKNDRAKPTTTTTTTITTTTTEPDVDEDPQHECDRSGSDARASESDDAEQTCRSCARRGCRHRCITRHSHSSIDGQGSRTERADAEQRERCRRIRREQAEQERAERRQARRERNERERAERREARREQAERERAQREQAPGHAPRPRDRHVLVD